MDKKLKQMMRSYAKADKKAFFLQGVMDDLKTDIGKRMDELKVASVKRPAGSFVRAAQTYTHYDIPGLKAIMADPKITKGKKSLARELRGLVVQTEAANSELIEALAKRRVIPLSRIRAVSSYTKGTPYVRFTRKK